MLLANSFYQMINDPSGFGVAVVVTFISIAGGVAIISVVAVQWRKTRVAAYNARLKQIMIERGMSVEEIERVIAAGVPRSDPKALHKGSCFSPRPGTDNPGKFAT